MKRTFSTTTYEIRFFNKIDETVYVENLTVSGTRTESAIKKQFLKNHTETEEVTANDIVILSVTAEKTESKTYEMSTETFISNATVVED